MFILSFFFFFREISQNVQFKVFKFAPRNRLLKNSFKKIDNTANSFYSVNETKVDSGVSKDFYWGFYEFYRFLAINITNLNTSMNGSWPKILARQGFNGNSTNNNNGSYSNGGDNEQGFLGISGIFKKFLCFFIIFTFFIFIKKIEFSLKIAGYSCYFNDIFQFS